MLLEFRAANYKSFVDEFNFSLLPSHKDRTLTYSILQEKCGMKEYKALCSAVLYGPNASGKSNIIGAMDTMRAIVERGNIRDSAVNFTPNVASYQLSLVSNMRVSGTPTSFGVRFVAAGHHYDYYFSAFLGDFLQKNQARRIVQEKLSIDGEMIFTRTDKLVFGEFSHIKAYIQLENPDNYHILQDLAEDNLNAEELFLCNGFRTIFAKDTAAKIIAWFSTQLLVIYRADAVRSGMGLLSMDDKTLCVEKTITEAAKQFGITANVLAYKRSERGIPELCSVFLDKQAFVSAESFESYGTIRFVNEFPFIMQALLTGATLVMDEFDASIHPTAIMNIINIFHNDDINVKHAQLIFNTHNPVFLRKYLFRKDEIKFVERDATSGESVHYALSDFKGEIPSNYMKGYFVNRFGALNDIDFTPLLSNVLGVKEGD